MISERELSGYKRQIASIRSEVDQATGTLKQLEAQEKGEIEKLNELGVTPETAKDRLEKLDNQAKDAIRELLEKFPELA